MGEVDTLAAGSPATAIVSGEPPDQILSLGIPAGIPGPANKLTIGSVTTLEAGADATAIITGDAPDQVLSLGIPQGRDGSGGGSEINISSDGKTYSPDDNGVIALGAAAGCDITHDTDSLVQQKLPSPNGCHPAVTGILSEGAVRRALLIGPRLRLLLAAPTP